MRSKIGFHQTLICLLLFSASLECYSTTPFEEMDMDKDGRLSEKEFKGPKSIFQRLDKNRDNFISKTEAIGTKLLGNDSLNKMLPLRNKPPLKYIDTHNHFMAIYKSLGRTHSDYTGSIKNALIAMDRCGVQLNMIMPPPQTLDQENTYTADNLLDAVKQYPDRFAFLAGGGTLNKMIQESIKEGKVSGSMRKKFKNIAEDWIKKGAIGFGEMTACHVSFNEKHPYVEAPPDHALFLLLADITAQNNVPIDWHMEAIPKNMPLPKDFKSPPNPRTLNANMPAFERLLKHNRQARFVWVHLGWDNTGYRDPGNTIKILKKHPNLFMSIRIPTKLHIKETPRASRIIDLNGKVKADWLEVFQKFPDRFVIGSDEFFVSGRGQMKQHGSTGSIDNTTNFLKSLPKDLEEKIGYKNAKVIYNLK